MKKRKIAVTACLAMTLLSGCGNSSSNDNLAKTQEDHVNGESVQETHIVEKISESAEQVSEVLVEEAGSQETELSQTVDTVGSSLTDKQSNAINMLNYLTVITTEIASSENGKLFLEEAYSSILDNANPNAIDDRTLGEFNSLLDTLEGYRMIETKRDRLEYIYEQNQAQALRSAVPNPIGLLSATKSFSIPQLVGSIAYMAIDSVTSYQNASSQADLKYLQDGWALDDDQAAFLHNQRKDTFSYMVKTVNENQIPTELALTEETVDTFVEWKNSTNTTSRIRFLESNKNTYSAFGDYWLTLAKSYYENGDFEKCLSAISEYESLKINIFRRDYDYAEALPIAIAAASEVYKGDDYVALAEHFADEILENTLMSKSKKDQWYLRYIAAQTYISIYSKTSDDQYLKKAYEIVYDNVNLLVSDQLSLNETYLSKIVKEEVPKGSTKSVKKEIQNYNKMLKEERKVELAPVSESLILNCDLLFALAEELKITEDEKNEIMNILHSNDGPLFLIETIDNQYCFSPKEIEAEAIENIDYSEKEFVVPAKYVSEDSVITVTITDGEGNSEVIDDWTVSKVKRGTEGELDTFTVIYKSEAAGKVNYLENTKVKVSVASGNKEALEFTFTTSVKKYPWIIPDDISFERI